MNEPTATKTCTKCGQAKPLSEFPANRSRADGHACWCRECNSADKRERRAANPEKYRAQRRQRYAANPGNEREYQRKRRQADPDQARQNDRQRYAANRDKKREQARSRWLADPQRAHEVKDRSRAKLRATVFAHYGESCACCGRTDRLTIDHVNGDGKAHRARLGTTDGDAVFRWLIRQGFPEGFQTLCFDCNNSKGTGQRCRIDHGKAA